MCVVAPLPACICLALPSSERGRLPYLEPGAQTQSSIRHPQYRQSLLKLKYSYKTNETPTLEGLFLTHFPFARDPHRALAAAAFTPGERADRSPNLAPKSSHETSRLCYYFHVAHPSIVFGNKIHRSIYSILF